MSVTTLTLELSEEKIKILHQFAKAKKQNINKVISDFIDIMDDSLFKMKPRKTKAPRDLSENVDENKSFTYHRSSF